MGARPRAFRNALTPIEEAWCQAYVACGGRVKEACRMVGLPEKPNPLTKPLIRQRVEELVQEALEKQGVQKDEAIRRLWQWIQESVPHERVRALELLARLCDWFPAEKRVTQHLAVAAGAGGTYAQLAETLREYGDRFGQEQLRMLRRRLEQELGAIHDALVVLESLEGGGELKKLPGSVS